MTIHIAVRYFDIVLFKIHLMEQDMITVSSSKGAEDWNSKLSYAIFQKSDALFMTARSEDRLKSLKNSKLELIALTWVLLACKFYERDENLVRIFELEKEFKYKYTFKNITTCENRILDELNWNVFVQTPNHYINLFLSGGILFTDDEIEGSTEKLIKHNKDPSLRDEESKFQNTLLESIKKSIESYQTHDYDLLQIPDRVVALAIIWAARKENKIKPAISPHLLKLYDIAQQELQEVMYMIQRKAIKIPLLKRESSFQSIPEVPNRANDIEIVIQGESNF